MITTLLTPSNRKNIMTAAVGKFFLAIVLVLAVGLTEMKAQVSAYTVDQFVRPATGVGAYTPLTSKTLIHSGTWDDNAPVNIPIGFTTPFKFNGTNYTTVNVSPNGFVYFGTASAGISTVYNPIGSANTYAGAIAGFGANIFVNSTTGTPQTNSVSYFLDTSGGVNNYKLIIEYRAVKRFVSPADNTGLISFQITLYETSNIIEVFHEVQTTGFTANFTGQVGLRGTSVADFNNLEYGTVAWTATPIPAGDAATDVVGIRSGANRIPATAVRLFRWTPVSCIAPLSFSLVAGSQTAVGATVQWTAPTPAPANGYQYEVRTSGAAGSGATGLAQNGTGTSQLVLTGLAAGTTYTVYVRSDCGGSFSAWTAGVSFTTLCAAQSVPPGYFQYFDPGEPGYNYTVPAIPPCSSIQNIGTGNNWVTEAPIGGNPAGFDTEYHITYNASGSNAANVWFYTQGVNLVAGQTYRLSYTYGGSTDFATITNKMEVAYGLSPYNTSMTNQLADHNNIKASPVDNVINFTAPSTNVFYFGFRAYSAANQGKLSVRTIEIVPAICIKPVVPVVSNVTYNSAQLNWTAPSPVPAGGYAYYLTTSLTPPSYTQIPTGFLSAGSTIINLNGLNGSTQYCFYVRGNCGSPDFSEWSSGVCFTTGVTPPYCFPTTALPDSYINNVTTTLATTNINNSSGYTSPGHADYTSLLVTQSQGAAVNFTIGLTGNGLGVGVAIWVDWDNDGTFTTAERMYNSAAYIFAASVSGSFVVPAGATVGTKRMRVMCDYWATSPSPCAFGTTGTTRGEIEDYSFKVGPPPPPLTLDLSASTQCGATNSPVVSITSALSNFDVYTWSPTTGVSGTAATGYTFNPSTSIIYTLTGTQTSGSFAVNTATYTYTANAIPTPINITPTATTSCQSGPAVQLTATGGVVSNVPIYSENFNGAAPGWTTVNASTGGATAAAAWTLRPTGYNPGGASGVGAMQSIDGSQFYISNSDAQGNGTNTDVTLTSPVFSLVGYTNASLSFYHYYKPWINGMGKVEIFSGGTWTTIQSWGTTANTVAQGTPTAFTNFIYNLTPYLGQANLQIRFNYTASWGYVWAIDNFVILGSATSAITWSPITGLYTDAAATTAYTAGLGTNTVYAMPSVTTQYTASASTPSPTVCSTTKTVDVTVTPIVGGALGGGNQNACSGIIANIPLTGQTGTIATWQTATNATFTAGLTNVPGSAGVTTMTSAILGTVNSTIYIRVQMTVGSCTAYSNVLTITVPTTTWTTSWSSGAPNATTRAIFNGNYTSTGNLNACSVQVVSGNVVFNAGHSLIAQNGVVVSGGSLTFNNNSSLVQVSDTAVNTGNITYRRDTTPMIIYDYTYWSSPVFPQTLAALSPLTTADKYYWWNTGIYNWQSIAAPGITTMTPGQGYIIRAPQNFTATPAVQTGQFVGVPNNGVVTMPIVVSGANNLNLLGNPYPSALDADLLMSASGPNATTLEGTIYLWTHNTEITNYNYLGSDYAVYNLSGGTGTGTAGGGLGNSNIPNGKIAAGQGFFIKGLASGTATINNSMRVAGSNNQFFRVNDVHATPQVLEKNRIWLEITNAQGAYKQALVGYIETATDARDRSFDGDFMDSGNVVGLYSIQDGNNEKLTIQGKALPFDVNDQVPMGYKVTTAGTYQIALSDFDGLFVDQNIYLQDNLLGTIHDLKSGAYSFTTVSGTIDSRFVLLYTNSPLGVNDPKFDDNSVIVYKNDNTIHINTSNVMMESVKVYDTRGRLILEKKGINSNETQIANLAAAQQVLIVQVTSVDNVTVSKKIIY